MWYNRLKRPFYHESMARARSCGLPHSYFAELVFFFFFLFSHIIINNCGGEIKTVDASVSL